MIVGLDEAGHERGAGQVEAFDVGGDQVGPGGQAGLGLGRSTGEQDALAPQQHRSPAAGAPGGPGVGGPLAVRADGGYVAENLKGARGVAAAPRDETVGGHQDGGATVQTLPAISGRGDPPGDLTGCGRAREGWGGIVGHDARIAGFRGPGSVASATGPRAGPAPASGNNRHHRPPGSARPPPPLRERGQPRGMMKELPRAKGNPGLSTASATGWAKSMRPSTSKPGSPSGSGVVSSSE